MFKGFQVSFALILGLKDEPYDLVIIIHVFIAGMDSQVGPAHWWAIHPHWEGVLPPSMPPCPLIIFLTF
jgi:hypothetical protein